MAKRFARLVKARFLGGALILGYHRVAKPFRDEYGICVSPEYFAEQMEVLSRYANPIRLGSLVHALEAGCLPLKAVAVTFDDGYADNLYQANPILQKFGIPATVFVCSGYVGKEFWWDELNRLVMSSQANIPSLELKVGNDPFVWKQTSRKPTDDILGMRSHFGQALYQYLLPFDENDRDQAMTIIRCWVGESTHKPTDTRALNQDELLLLSQNSLIDIGAHTRNHPFLPRLSFEQQRTEIVSGKDDLEALLGKRIEGFSYPNGRATPDAKRIAQDVGFEFACTSLQDMVRPGGDRHELTRFWQNDVDGDMFMKTLRLWMKI